MKFKIDGREVEVFVNGEKQSKSIKKVKLSDDGKKINEVVDEFIAKKEKEK
ncbi:MAG TPA: hypothetical protein VMV86_02070 [Methanosarcinales archaeon]|nr:hypothetical protein [Methanosarcinales archaeon]